MLRRIRERIVALWRESILADPRVPEANRLSEPALRDHVPELLGHLASVLQRAEATSSPEALSAEETPASEDHADQRLDDNYDLAAALRELSHLRIAIYDALHEDGCHPDHTAVRVIASALDELMTTAALRMQEAASEALSRSEAKYRRIADANVIGVIESTLDGRILAANDAFLAMTGHSREDLQGAASRWDDLTPSEYREADARVTEQLRAHGRAAPTQKEYVRKDGSRLHVIVAAALVPGVDDVAIVVVVSTEALWQAELELHREAEIRERLVAVLAHDLRQPLSSLRLGLELLTRQTDLDPRVAPILVRLTRAGERMSHMVGDLLDFARATHGGIPMEPAPGVAIRELIERVAAETEGAHEGVEIRVEGPEVLGAWDPQRLAQVFANLLGNAVAHGDSRKPVLVRIHPLPQRVEVAVQNQNRGAPLGQVEVEQIFSAFRRGARPGGTGGLGLGLYIAAQVIQAHAGTIAVASDASGTTFSVTLPRAEAGPS